MKLFLTRGKADIKATTNDHRTHFHLTMYGLEEYHFAYAKFLLRYYNPAVFLPGHLLTLREAFVHDDRDVKYGMAATSHIHETLLRIIAFSYYGDGHERVREANVTWLLETGNILSVSTLIHSPPSPLPSHEPQELSYPLRPRALSSTWLRSLAKASGKQEQRCKKRKRKKSKVSLFHGARNVHTSFSSSVFSAFAYPRTSTHRKIA